LFLAQWSKMHTNHHIFCLIHSLERSSRHQHRFFKHGKNTHRKSWNFGTVSEKAKTQLRAAGWKGEENITEKFSFKCKTAASGKQTDKRDFSHTKPRQKECAV
jgi:hypothetical protein